METRHREEEENLVHCLVSSGGGWTQGFLAVAPVRGVPTAVNSPVHSSQYILCLHKCTCAVSCCSVPFLCVHVFPMIMSAHFGTVKCHKLEDLEECTVLTV